MPPAEPPPLEHDTWGAPSAALQPRGVGVFAVQQDVTVKNASSLRRHELIVFGSNLGSIRRQAFVGGVEWIVCERCRLWRQDLKRPV